MEWGRGAIRMNAGSAGLDTKDLVDVRGESIWSDLERSGLPDVTVKHVWIASEKGGVSR